MEAVLNSTTNINTGGEDDKENKPYGRVEILNYYQKQDEYNSITTEFYCRLLKNKTPHACEYAQNNLGLKGPRVSLINEKVFYDEIVVTAHQKGWFGKNMKPDDLKIVKYVPTEKGAVIDIDTIATTTHRIEVRNELIQYHTETLQKTYIDLPLLCPMRNDLQHLSDNSIAFEELVQPELGPHHGLLGLARRRNDFLLTRYRTAVRGHRVVGRVSEEGSDTKVGKAPKNQDQEGVGGTATGRTVSLRGKSLRPFH